jgi:hypothetical protein
MSDYFGLYDRDGQPITSEEFNALLELPTDYRRVAATQVGPYWVSTVWLGVDHGWGRGAPLIFETMVFAAEGEVGPDLDQLRYSTEAEARAGHAETVLLIRATMLTAEDVLPDQQDRS